MSTQITNVASLSFDYGDAAGTAVSNTASILLGDPVNVSKTALETEYTVGSSITYILQISNTGAAALSGITIRDDLGTYTLGGVPVTPLNFDGNALYFVGGTLVSAITGSVGANSVTFTINTLPAGTNGMIVYTVTVNDKAPRTAGASITNTAVFSYGCTTNTVSETVYAAENATVEIIKEMSPDTVYPGDTVTYTFRLFNSGNLPAENVVLTDHFASPAPTITAVRVNGVLTTDYSYAGGVLTLPSAGTPLTIEIPAAAFTQASDGTVTVTPGTTLITVTGIIGCI